MIVQNMSWKSDYKLNRAKTSKGNELMRAIARAKRTEEARKTKEARKTEEDNKKIAEKGESVGRRAQTASYKKSKDLGGACGG
ncbi:hypothetical protein Sjap_024484 [Stephania japonica]|uniref:Uncharacterized protein n=1 Tax=Stephania japonica TaxID=461633 RepID=A0AAP0EIA8_9MAGN